MLLIRRNILVSRWQVWTLVALFVLGGWQLFSSDPNTAQLQSAPPEKEGPKDEKKWKVDKIIIIGNNLTPENFIRRRIPFDTGAKITAADLKTAEKNLERLDLFRNDPISGIRPRVTILDEDGDGEVKDILVDVDEQYGNRFPLFVRWYFRHVLVWEDEFGSVIGLGLDKWKDPVLSLENPLGEFFDETETMLAFGLATVRTWWGKEGRRP